MPDQLTVKDLFEECKKAIEEGNGDRLIVVSNDAGDRPHYHGLFAGFDLNIETIILDTESSNTERDIIFLG